MADQDAVQRCYREFVDLLPMTLAISGLGPHDGSRSLTTDQMEARANVIQLAFRIARERVRESIREG